MVDTFCMFNCIGQSNMTGAGNVAESTLAPKAGVCISYNPSSNIFVHCTDPLPGGGAGSIIPALAAEFYNKTGHRVIMIQNALDGGILTPENAAAQGVGTNFWGNGGILLGNAFTRCDAAFALMASSGFDCFYGGTILYQGESEGSAILDFPGVTNGPQWEREFNFLDARVRTKYGPSRPMFVIQLGTVTGALAFKEPGFKEIRAAIEHVVDTPPPRFRAVVSRLSLEGAEQYGLLSDIHNTQSANNRIGRDAGANIAATGWWRR